MFCAASGVQTTTLDYISHSSQIIGFCEGLNSAKQGLAPVYDVLLHFWRITGACAPVLLTGGQLHSCATGDSEVCPNVRP